MIPATWQFMVATCIKILLFPSYRSTDFEVHRHWLALTKSLPLSQWYSDTSSQWTLDYPPFFAHLELLLSYPSVLIDPLITDLNSHNYATIPTIIYLRLTVVVIDLVLFFAVKRLTVSTPPALTLVVFSPALLIVDHVHFQYNGYFLGLLLLSISFLSEGKDLVGGILFAVLICSKHLFAVAAPVYFVYLLRHYCVGGLGKRFARFVTMGAAVGVVSVMAFGPFVYHGQILQVLQRLFPFDRGLCHAYWAPNFWVFYIVLDKALAFVLSKIGFDVRIPAASFTGGLVGDSSPFSVLPMVTPITTFLLVLLAMSPCIIKAFMRPQPKHIVRWIAYAYTCGFMFGWHVHEKASLHFVIPLAITAFESFDDAKHYFLLCIVSCYSMFPLLFEPQEYPIKVLLLLTYSVLMWESFTSYFRKATTNSSTTGDTTQLKNMLIDWATMCYLLGLLVVELWVQFLHPLVFGERFPFLPLMLISVYCAVGMLYSWVWQLVKILKSI